MLGVEPALNVAEAAVARGVPTLTEFFGADLGRRLAEERGTADLVLGNNVLAQVPDINDFVAGRRSAARAGGDGDVRVPAPREADRAPRVRHDLPRALLVLLAPLDPRDLRRRRGSTLVDVEELPSHGGSLRVFLQHAEAGADSVAGRRRARSPARTSRACATPETLPRASPTASRESKRALLELLIGLRRAGQAGRRLRRARQGQHAAQLLRHPHGLPRLHGRPEPVQAGQAHAGDAHPDPSAGAASPRRGRT